MSNDGCDRLWELDALREGRLGAKDADAAERHIRTCPVCTAARARSDELDTWLEGASSREPTSLELRRVRIRVLRSVGAGEPVEPRPWLRVALAGALLVFVGAGGLFAHRHFAVKNPAVAITTSSPVASSIAPTTFAATVRAADGTRWTQARSGSTEHVALDEGTLFIHVRPRLAQEQLLVELPDGILEDRGTTFEVEAHGGRTTRVAVSEGSVALRIRGAAEVLLHAGATWPPAAASSAQANLPPSPIHVKESSADDGAASYAAAMALFRDRSFAPAAKAFHAYVQAHPHEPDAEDASYLEAVALSQAGDAKGATAAAERHLLTYPRSFHRKEASLLVARVARDEGNCEKARRFLAPWLGAAPDAEAQATLRSCVEP